MSDLSALLSQATTAITSANDLTALEDLRVSWLGKKGHITEQLKTLGALDPEARKARGAELNQLKDKITDTLDARKAILAREALNAQLANETLDVTLLPRPENKGRIHPITQTIDEIIAIFTDMGFAVAEGPQIEDDFHNFTALNIPPEHPARQMHDTFYLNTPERHVLRTHTSPVQIRTMKAGKPPFRFIAPGSTYRNDSDMTHTPMFHQVEGLVIEKNIHMGHLKGTIAEFLKAFFEIDEVPLRFRPSFFPFTEPSAEVDIGCARGADGIKIGAGKDWLEIMGCGMVHPNVLKSCGIDPEEWQGFAFGMGIERIAMLKYGMPDLRAFFEGDLRWLNHYGFEPLDIPNLATGLSK